MRARIVRPGFVPDGQSLRSLRSPFTGEPMADLSGRGWRPAVEQSTLESLLDDDTDED